jgi:hypothetical protein
MQRIGTGRKHARRQKNKVERGTLVKLNKKELPLRRVRYQNNGGVPLALMPSFSRWEFLVHMLDHQAILRRRRMDREHNGLWSKRYGNVR